MIQLSIAERRCRNHACRYFVRHAAKPKDRLALALAVNVGSLLEEDHEQGVAHILEHLAFSATEVREASLLLGAWAYRTRPKA